MKTKFLCAAILSLATATAMMAQTTDSNSTDDSSTTAPSQQQEHHWGHRGRHFWGGGFFHELHRLDLTDAQKQQVHQIFASNKATFHTGFLNLLKAKQALQNAIDSNPDNQTTIQTLATNVANAEAALTVQRTTVRAQVIKLLTDNQKTQLSQLEAKRQAHLQQAIDRLSKAAS